MFLLVAEPGAEGKSEAEVSRSAVVAQNVSSLSKKAGRARQFARLLNEAQSLLATFEDCETYKRLHECWPRGFGLQEGPGLCGRVMLLIFFDGGDGTQEVFRDGFRLNIVGVVLEG